ncbi:MAG: hypothetical protein IKW85_11190, partial [Muribaculaceae bacterium]|nr:hypothetical protein [Muribaculaceae bacterium]
NLLAYGPSPILRNTEIRLTGTNMQKVDKVIFPGNAIVERSAFNRSDNENIYCNVPDESVPGQIRLVAGNDTIVSIGTLVFQEPIEVTNVTPVTGLNAGDIISITGDYVYNIAEVVFTRSASVIAEDFEYVSRREIRVRVPLAAETGTITMNDGADWEFTYETPLEIVSASYLSLEPAAADFGEQIMIHGTNLHTVEQVLFAGGVASEFIVSEDNRTIIATVPAECKSGAISLLLYSGAALQTDAFSVPTVVITGASQSSDLVAGDVVTLYGENFDRIIEVTLPGGSAPLSANEYTIVDNTLTFTVPEYLVDGDVVVRQNSNITATYPLEIRKLAGVIWQGNEELSGWSNWGVFNWSGDLWTKFQEAITGPGQMTVHFVATNSNPIFNFRMGDWSTPLSGLASMYGADGNITPGTNVTDLVFDITAEEAAQMFGNGGLGMVIWGDGIKLQYVKFIGAGAEQVIWEGREDTSGWGNNITIGTDTSPELAACNPQEGSVVRFYGE